MHEFESETVRLRFQFYVYFAESHTVNRNLFGRQGWLLLVVFALDDYRSEIYFSLNLE